MDIDWKFLVGAVIVLAVLGIGVYACNWLANYTTLRHEEKLQKRLKKLEEANNRRMQEMRAQSEKDAAMDDEDGDEDDSKISEEEMTLLMAKSIKRAETTVGTTPKRIPKVRKRPAK